MMRTVYLLTADNISQATMVKDVLFNEGIESLIKNEIISSVLNISEMRVELEVFEKDYQRAYDIVKNGFPDLIEGEK